MRLRQLLEGLYLDSVDSRFQDLEIEAIACDSRKVTKNSIFAALSGVTCDGADFIDKAIDRGASTIITSRKLDEAARYPNTCFIYVDDPHRFLRDIVKRFYNDPSRNLRIIGVTGTNGKTTVTYLIESILHQAEKACGIIGTVNYRIGENILPAGNTTPGFLEIHQLLAQMVEQGAEYCIMEVSSHALDQGRVDGLDFHTAVFTNLTSDHLDYHHTRENYFAAKAKLFVGLSSQAHAVINADDVYGKKIFSKTKANILTYGIDENADVMARDIEMDLSGTKFKILCPEGEIIIRTKLVGKYNVANILAAFSAGLAGKIGLEKIKNGIESLTLVPGRLETVDCGQDFAIIIDYAHTADALENVLTAIRHAMDTKIILVFGCGGDRDKTKRPVMGKIASQLADFSIVTSDNSRSEEPEAIIKQIVEGFENDHYEIIVNREEAIRKALGMAHRGDVVLIAGKGHETYQIFKDKIINFDERKVIRQFILC